MQFHQQKKTIIFHLFALEPVLKTFLFESINSKNLRAAPDVILSNIWELTLEQQILVRIALDIWNGKGQTFLWEMLNKLSMSNLSHVLKVLTDFHKNSAPHLSNSNTLDSRKTKWNRQPRRHLQNLKDDPIPPQLAAKRPYKVTRLKERKRKKKHEAYTLTPQQKLWIFEDNPKNGGKNA
ncbi:MAG: hypothetical protein K2Q26_09145 [Bdellovibrionales bacterium]|nr:hypothetical protein [Bdellovibrionales bacterium]